jgi:hypothetical protein
MTLSDFLPVELSSPAVCNLPPAACGCFIVRTGALQPEDRNEFFGAGDVVELVDEGADVLDLLVLMKVFPSKGQARKNWRGPVQIPPGWTETATSKSRNRKFLFVWKP